MNAGEIIKMPAGREMDALVAEFIFYWIWIPSPLNTEQKIIVPTDKSKSDIIIPDSSAWWWGEDIRALVPYYSTDIAAAWQVVEKMSRPDWAWIIESFNLANEDKPRWFACFWGDIDGELCSDASAEADTAPLAICRAALLAILKEGD